MEFSVPGSPGRASETTVRTEAGRHKTAASVDLVYRATPAEKLLARLEGVKRTGPHTWKARCPTRADRHPSLDIREKSNGALLIIDRAGIASAGEILDAVGLSACDLFPRNMRSPRYGKPKTPPFDYAGFRDVAREGLVAVALALADIANGIEISRSDIDYLRDLSKRLLRVLDLAGTAR